MLAALRKRKPHEKSRVTLETGWRTWKASPEGRSGGRAGRGDRGAMLTDWGCDGWGL